MANSPNRRLTSIALGVSLSLGATGEALAGYSEVATPHAASSPSASRGTDRSEELRRAHARIEELEREVARLRGELERKSAVKAQVKFVKFNGPQSFTKEGLARLSFVSQADSPVGNLAPTGLPPTDDPAGLDVSDAGMRVFFDSGSASVSLDRAEADALIAVATGAKQVVLRGRTDSTGSASINKTVALKRADALRQLLLSNGVAASRVSVQAEPFARYIGDNKTARGRALNRRVDIAFF